MNSSMMILIAGPYRSGTADDPQKMANNLAVLEQTALAVWQKGHLPVIGEWLALPLIKKLGSQSIGDNIWQSLAYPVADRLLTHCHGILRLPGESKGADGDVSIGHKLGLNIYTDIAQLPLGVVPSGRT
jgi:hypothetical protein